MILIDRAVKDSIITNQGTWLRSTNQVKSLTAHIEALNSTAEGKPFIDIKGRDENGNPVALSDFIGKGKYVLLDVWTSWCGPCKGELPNLAKLHNQYKDNGFTVLGLFVCDKEENLKKAIENENIT